MNTVTTRVGSLGDVGCFSFYPGKNLGAFGEGGAIVTNNVELHDKLRILRDHGQVEKYRHDAIGWNGRMDGIQGAVLQIKLRELDKNNDLRYGHALRYDRAFEEVDKLVLPRRSPESRHVYHLYVIQVPERDELMSSLKSRGIGFGIHYPVPIHLQKAYEHLGYPPGAFPVSERCATRFLSLPMFPELTSAQVDFVAESVREAVSG